MKKHLLIIMILLPFFAKAQEDTDLFDFSSVIIQGTAKSAAMGNAMGAVGSDFSSMAINPAGLGMFRKASFIYTLGINASGTNSTYMGKSSSDRAFRMPTHNIGLTWTQDINDGTLKTVSFALGINTLNNYTQNSFVNGNNPNTSLIDAYLAEIEDNNITNDYELEDFSPNNMFPLWETYLLDFYDDGSCGSPVPQGGLNQQYGLSKRGMSREFSFASGLNFNERFFLGVSVNIPYFDRSATREYKENNLTSGQSFRSWSQTEKIVNSGWGINAKIGAILYPAKWVRIGASIHTPYLYKVTESWFTETNSAFSDGAYSYTSPTGAYSYTLTTPLRFNASAAFIFGNFGMITGDYEYVDYSKMRASSYDYDYNYLNDFIKEKYTGTSNIRIGTEWRWQTLAFRAGYAIYGSPFGFGKEALRTTSYSCGLGYTYHKFTIDAAYVFSQRKNSYDLYALYSSSPAYYIASGGDWAIDDTKVKETTNNNQVVISLKFRLD